MKKTLFSLSLLFALMLMVSCQNDMGSGNEGGAPVPPPSDLPLAKDVQVEVSSGDASSYQAGAGLSNSFDGDMGTIYHSNWSNGAQGYFPITLTYNFENVKRIDYLVYNPRQSGSNGNFREFEVQVSTQANPEFVKYGDFDFGGSGSAGIISFTGGVDNPRGVRFVVRSGAGDGQGFASCAEMQFFVKASQSFRPSTIFADELCTTLRPEITKANIDTISVKFYKDLAKNLLAKTYNFEFRVQQFRAFINPDVQSWSHKINPYSLLDNPTGISVDNDQELIVLVGPMRGKSIGLKIQDLDEGYGGSSYALTEGLNVIRTSNKGLIYVMYHTPDGKGEPVKMHIASGRVNGYFDVAKHKAEDWTRLIDGASNKYFDVLGKYSHMTYTTAAFRNYTKNGKALADATDSIVRFQHELMGLYKYNKELKNRIYMHVVYGDSYMYATSYRTAYHEGTLSTLASEAEIKAGGIWGPAHEIGHCNQTRPGFKWHGMTEVSNNLFSQYCQQRFGISTRLQSEDMGAEHVNRFGKAFNTLLLRPDVPHCKEGDVFCKLVPFWQLQLYFGNVLGRSDVYPAIFEMVRTQGNPSTEGLAQLNFVRLACQATGTNLLDFFRAWGMLTPVNYTFDDYGVRTVEVTQEQADALVAEIEAKNYPQPRHCIEYIYDDAVYLYKNNARIQMGTVTRSGWTLTFNSWQNVVAFELYEGGVRKRATVGTQMMLTAETGCKVYAVAADGERVEAKF